MTGTFDKLRHLAAATAVLGLIGVSTATAGSLTSVQDGAWSDPASSL